MNFKSGANEQAQEVIFNRKLKVTAQPQLVFNNNPVHETATQKYLGMFLDFKLNFQEHFENMLNKVNKPAGLLILFLDHHYGQFISYSLDRTLIMVILYMIKRKAHLFKKK